MTKPIELLKESTVNQEVLKREFIDYLPRRFEFVMDMMWIDEDDALYSYMLKMYHHLDSIDYHYRHFLKGHSKNLRRVFYEFRQLPLENIMLGLSIIYEIGTILDTNELYEMMDKHHSAKDKIQKLILKLHKEKH